ncbi:hypothetical protein Aperf_G00000039186 [Anoplocephala perfoliata]
MGLMYDPTGVPLVDLCQALLQLLHPKDRLLKNAETKIQDLFQWIQDYSSESRRDVRESCKLMYDVQVVEGIVRIFKDWSPLDKIHPVCQSFCDAYLSRDKRSKFFVTLFLPTLLHAYLVRLHSSELAVTTATSGPISRLSPSPSHQASRHVPSPTFTLGSDSQPSTTNPLESLAFLLSDLCQFAPAFIRYPELHGGDPSILSDYRVASIYHTPPFSASKSFQQFKMRNNSSSSTLKYTETPAAGIDGTAMTQSQSILSDINIDLPCIVRIYLDAMARHFVEGTEEQQAVVLVSIRTYCDMVDRLTALNTQRVLYCAHHHHLELIVELTIGIDKLLYMLAFELVQPEEQRTDTSGQMEELRDRMVKVLLPQIERYASYHCFASVLLVVGAVRNAWRLRLSSSSTTTAVTIVPLYRRVRLTSDELADISSSSNSDEISAAIGEPVAAVPSPRRPSIFTNANFRAEPVAEDIPIADANLPVESGKRKLHLLHGHNRTNSVHNHLRHLNHFNYRQDEPDNFGNNGIVRSTEDIHRALSSSTLSLDQDGAQHQWRFWNRLRRG